MRELTRENVSEALAKLVERFGRDYVYVPPSGPQGDCVYFCTTVDGLEPSCLWGHVLTDLGMSYAELETHKDKSLRNLLRDIGVTDDGLRRAAMRSQSLQDTGSTWGVAYDAFKRKLNENPSE